MLRRRHRRDVAQFQLRRPAAHDRRRRNDRRDLRILLDEARVRSEGLRRLRGDAMGGATFAARLAEAATATERTLDALLSASPATDEIARPGRLIEAMRYATLGGGKRLRAFLVIETARTLGRTDEAPVRAGAAVECLHAYSLVHDDLPAMDDDDLRRGKPTVHRAFDEATAILVGDALQALAFEILADPATERDPLIRAALCLGLARAAGLAGMVGGQVLDLAAESAGPLPPGDIRRLQAMKTGALLAFSVSAGAMLGGAAPQTSA